MKTIKVNWIAFTFIIALLLGSIVFNIIQSIKMNELRVDFSKIFLQNLELQKEKWITDIPDQKNYVGYSDEELRQAFLDMLSKEDVRFSKVGENADGLCIGVNGIWFDNVKWYNIQSKSENKPLIKESCRRFKKVIFIDDGIGERGILFSISSPSL